MRISNLITTKLKWKWGVQVMIPMTIALRVLILTHLVNILSILSRRHWVTTASVLKSVLLEGESTHLTAKYFIIAAHAPETARLLLFSDVANSSDQVG